MKRGQDAAAVTGAAARSAPWDPTVVPLPRHAQIEPIGRCNLACRMCTVNHRPDVGQLSLADFVRLLDQMPQLASLHLQGLGEPMLHPDFFTMVQQAVARGIRVSTNTNATLITPTRARACVTSNLAELSISLDGARAATYEAVRIGARFDKVVRNIGRLVRVKQELGSATPQLRLVLVLMRSNLYEIPALIDLAAELSVPSILVQRLSNELTEPELPARYIPIRRYVHGAELRPNDLAEAADVFAVARARAMQLGIALHLPRLFPRTAGESSGRAQGGGSRMLANSQEQRGPRCSWPFDSLYFTARGDVLPCCMVATSDRLNLGNALAKGVVKVFNGEAARQLRRELLEDRPNSLCRACALYRGTF
jgi:MoaA/NifB/PqqE/SkfB family radical SAM enzyme